MVYDIYWYNDEKTIIVLKVVAPYTWTDAFQAFGHMNAEISSVDHDVTSIYDLHGFPLPKNAMRAIQIGINMQLKNEKLIIFVTDSPVLASLINTVSSIYGFKALIAKYRYVSTFKEAVELALSG